MALKAIVSTRKFLLLTLLLIGSVLAASPLNAQLLKENSHYRDGLQAYLDGDYLLAQSSWLQGAQAKHAKSMFNLGLLHQQGKLLDADPVKAEKWFRLAAKNGYVAANYHLAMWLKQRGASAAQVQGLVEAAAKQGFAPARGNSSNAVATNLPSADLSAAPLSAAKYKSEAYIKRLAPQSWTIQMLAFEQRSKVIDFIDSNGIHQQAAYFAEANNDGTLFKLIYGNYKSKAQAEKARDALPKSMMKHGPWLRSIAGVQSIIAKQ